MAFSYDFFFTRFSFFIPEEKDTPKHTCKDKQRERERERVWCVGTHIRSAAL